MENKNSNEEKLSINLSEEIADGVYSNLAIISHSTSEFICDFAQLVPGIAKAKVRSRVIMTPENAKKLLYALQDNIRKYEDNFGKINENNRGLPPINFGTPPTEA